VGDYRNVDWEKLAQIRPDAMIVQYARQKMPPGLAQRAKELGIHLVNVHNNHLTDIFSTIQQLGRVLDEPGKADAAGLKLRKQINAVSQSVAGELPIRTFIALEPTALATVGGGNYLNEILSLAGGKNVVQGGENAYPTIDREKLAALDPEVVIVLLPGQSDQVVQEARRFWNQMTQIRAVQQKRVYIWTEPWLLLPGWEVGDLARKMAKALHPHVRSDEGTSIENWQLAIGNCQLSLIRRGAS
jgi:iron complex transport system substrate-binding protein